MSRFNWDSNNDGVISSNDILQSFDTNTDGLLDANELSAFTEQLSIQLQYNNTLLDQIHGLEQNNLVLQKDLHVKQEALIHNSRSTESLKEELQDTKRKFKIAQDISENLTRQLRECRLENNLIRKEIDDATNNQVLANSELEQSRKDVQALKRVQLELQESKKREIELLEGALSDGQNKYVLLKNVNESLSKEVGDLRSKLLSIDGEKRDLTTRVNQITQSFEDVNRVREADLLARQQAEKSSKQLSTALELLQDRQLETEYAHSEAQQLLAVRERELHEAESDRDGVREKLGEAEEEVLDLTHRLNGLVDEKQAVLARLDQTRAEHAAQLKKLRGDHERQVDLLSSKQAEMAHLLEDAKAHFEASLSTAQHQIQATHKARAVTEDKLQAAQNTVSDLHNSMDRMAGDLRQEREQSASERQKTNSLLTGLKQSLAAAERRMEELSSRASADKEEAVAAAHSARVRFIESHEQHVEMLSAVQAKVTALSVECSASRGQVKDLLNQVQLYKKKLGTIGDNNVTALGNLRSEFVALLKSTQGLSAQKREQLESVLDDSRRHQLAKEEEVSKSLMLEEYVSRLEHDASVAHKRLGASEKDTALALRKQSLLAEKLAVEKKEAEDKCRTAESSAQEATEKIKSMQQSIQQLQAMLTEQNSRQSANRHDVDSKVSQLSAQLSRAVEERDSEARRSDGLAERNSALLADLQRTKSDAGNWAAQVDALRRENQDILLKQQQALNSAGGATQQYHAQFVQTQELLKTVQAQRAELLAQNGALRSELNRIYGESQPDGADSNNSGNKQHQQPQLGSSSLGHLTFATGNSREAWR